jgi:hypothetical protein
MRTTMLRRVAALTLLPAASAGMMSNVFVVRDARHPPKPPPQPSAMPDMGMRH